MDVVEGAGATVDRDLLQGDAGGSSAQLQAIVEEASRVLGRPVVISDRHLRLLAYTQHADDDLDRTRRMVILKQPVPPELVEWLDERWSAERPFRLPANPSLEYDARVVAPITCHGHNLGSMNCLDREQTMTDADLERLGAFADEAAVVLYREMLLADLHRSRERELLRDILSTDESIRREAAWQLTELDIFPSGGRIAVVVVPLDATVSDRSPDETRLAVEPVLMRIRRRLAPKHGLHLVRPDHALLLVSLADPGIRAKGISAFAEDIHAEVVNSLPDLGGGRRQIVAVGGVAHDLGDGATSYQQALRTAAVAATVSSFGDVLCWDDLGIYQILTEIPIDVLGPNALHPSLARLLEDPRARDLVPTLERYLDLACDVQQTAASLYLHRTTLYHRLRRIERIANVDLRNGDDRLALHLSLKIARLQGLTWAATAEEPAKQQR